MTNGFRAGGPQKARSFGRSSLKAAAPTAGLTNVDVYVLDEELVEPSEDSDSTSYGFFVEVVYVMGRTIVESRMANVCYYGTRSDRTKGNSPHVL